MKKHMEENIYLELLAKREIQPTAIRLLVLKAMMQAGRSVSLADLEATYLREQGTSEAR